MNHSLMNIRKLRHVVALATHGNYASAARELNLSPSALSRSIQSVEKDIKLVLFTRGKGGVFITPAGARVVNAAHVLMQNVNDLQDSLRNLNKVALGDAAFGIGPMASATLLPALFERSLADNKVRVNAHIDSGPVLLELLNSGKIEFFLCTRGAVGRLPNVLIENIASIKTSLRVRSGHPLAGKKHITRDMLDEFQLVGGNFEENARLNIKPSLPYRYL
jgi:DNA-binding transcriptional LysR family regulator